ncbi:hypothetical protein B484DRAFT_389132, partial [Ochromonadaceae sp. CCMP2298]
ESSAHTLAEIRTRTPLGQALLKAMPWCVDFHQRMLLFRGILDAERLQVQGSNDIMGPERSRGSLVRVRRSRLLEDGMEAFSLVNLKDRIVVRYVSDFGEEAGIDAGGLFKDLLTDLSKTFDPSYGLFKLTPQHLLYPNPSAGLLYADQESLFLFLGRLLGKALFENVTLQPQFAHFFLALMGTYNFA